jgi:glycosyltransferase involved in cell wall biosynthesis
MDTSKPLVSIAMPTYNGEKYIRQSLDSLLSQDYENIEIIISDNASTDNTEEICREYVAKDRRVQYHRNETNLGATRNFNRSFELSNGKYFMWAADHDLWHPTFVSSCVSVLERNPNTVLVYSQTMLIDPEGNPLGIMPEQIDTRGMPPLKRFKHVIWNLGWCNLVYGVILSKALKQTGLFYDVCSPDNVLLAELTFRGEFAQITTPLYYRRKNRPDEELEAHKRRVLYDLNPASAAQKSKRSFEGLYRDLRNAYFRMIIRAPIGFFEKIDAVITTVICFRKRRGVSSKLVMFAQWISLQFISLPVETNNISYYLDRISVQSELKEVEGWAFIKGQGAEYSHIYLVLKSNTRTYTLNTIPRWRTDVTQAFRELNLNLNESGFKAYIPQKKTAEGVYKIGIYIQNKDMKALEYTDKILVVP